MVLLQIVSKLAWERNDDWLIVLIMLRVVGCSGRVVADVGI